ncbi:hypothetical protein BX616_000085 [Lobosporangium transversale]|uniref:Calpain catalytic domain-containing protein n=1 Tax=Lobosporangium transversale TaxID=64571 RepID=A0A1Y2GFR5_9FUNG|nr:hypothetical protein BCR41DRAFT_358229 [Lobosporangium transversale]KAF9908595.1 hypothetical protein BX616_000085 [Lobosporangium transversale]ORZ09647.1 hypothetical protein BCR41DRAFT_358229 [Lobosporangium transversale]|eukprot:XP_021878917.1 hypothetical protein BCR41DRAFT_358229 [Lobosporangium transversale]
MPKKFKSSKKISNEALSTIVAAVAKHNKTLQLPSVTLVATSAMVAAREACAAKVDAIVEECLAKNVKFRDSKFDLLNDRRNCLYASLISETVYKDIAGTKRITDLFKNPVFFLNGASPDDIKQGSVGDCWFVASLAVISNIPGLLEQLCVKKNEQVGVYGFIFFKDGDWVSTVVDDQMFYKIDPVTHSRSLYFSSCYEERESWLPLMEKAYAKIHGDYETLTGGYTSEGIEDLTGGTASMMFSSDILDKDRFWEEEMKQVNKVTLMGCSINYQESDPENHGIQSGHAYSVLNVAEYDGERLVHIRNPWGKIEWNGDWSDQSDKWTPDAIKTLKLEDKDDGRFWMPYDEFLRIFTTIDRCRVFDATWSVASSWIPYNVEPRSSGKFQFKLNQPGETVIVLSQPDTRYYGAFNAEFIYTLSFHVYDQDEKLIRRAKITVPYSRRSVNCELKLAAGTYTVIPHVHREPTDIRPDTENSSTDNAINPSTRIDDVEVVVDPVKMDKSSYMFQQRKATLVRSMSMARITGRKLLGVDDEDYEANNNKPKQLEEQRWQLMLGLRVYSHDRAITVDGNPGVHPSLKRPQEGRLDVEEKEDPESVTATLADKKELSTEPEEIEEEAPQTSVKKFAFRKVYLENRQ